MAEQGTAAARFEPVVGRECLDRALPGGQVVRGREEVEREEVFTRLQAISVMDEYQGKSFEELRCEDYTVGLINVRHRRQQNEQIKRLTEELEKTRTELERKDKDLETKENKALETLVNHLRERVKCPVCLVVPTTGPVFSCPRGHLTCTSCYQRLLSCNQGLASSCPMCRTTMTGSTSLLALTVIENIEQPCRNEGCEVKGHFAEIEKHRKHCNFTPFQCPLLVCGEVVDLKKLLNHLSFKCKHTTLFGFKNVQKNTISQSYHVLCPTIPKYVDIFQWKGQIFFLTILHDSDRKCTLLYAQLLGTKEDCSRYKVRMSFGGKVVESLKEPFKMDVNRDTLESGGLTINDEVIKTYCDNLTTNIATLGVKLDFEEV